MITGLSTSLLQLPYLFFLPKYNVSIPNKSALWHLRLVHAPLVKLIHISSVQNDFHDNVEHICSACPLTKQTRNVFYKSTFSANQIFEHLHCDVWGPYDTPTLNGFRFFLTIVDDKSRGVWAYLIKYKSEVPSHLQNFILLVQTQFNAKVKIVRSDQGTEYFNSNVNSFILSDDIIH